ncbi:MAG TPA: MOSC domain-containing protein [Planococcus sp. (in: firmicutes)]|nr:MOSC domain-containing protein [Planococcus sp. (in: firmicutes)]
MNSIQKAEIKYFAIGMPEKLSYGEGKEMLTAICKKPVQQAFLSKEGFQGDGVADTKHHGGPERAVCIYPYEHYARWEKEFGIGLPPAAFGENLTLTNMLEETIHIGDIIRIGEAVVQVTQGRVPCNTIDRRLEMAPLLKVMVKTGYTGYLCRVLEEGMVASDDRAELIERDSKRITVLFANNVNFHQPNNAEAIQQVLEAQALAAEWRDWLTKRLKKLTI